MMLASEIIRPLVCLLPNVAIMTVFGRAYRRALTLRRPDVPASRVLARRSLANALDFGNYVPAAATDVQRMRDCLLLRAVVGFPVFAVEVFW